MLKCNYGESFSPWTPWENTSKKTLGRLMFLLNQGKEQPGLSTGSPSLHTLPMQLLGPPSYHPQTSKCYFPQVLHEKNKEKEGEREEQRTSFQLCALGPVDDPLPGQADERMRLWTKQGTHLFSEQKWEGCRQQTLRRESCSKSGGWQHVSTASQPGDGSHHGRRHLPQEPRRSSRNSPCARH